MKKVNWSATKLKPSTTTVQWKDQTTLVGRPIKSVDLNILVVDSLARGTGPFASMVLPRNEKGGHMIVPQYTKSYPFPLTISYEKGLLSLKPFFFMFLHFKHFLNLKKIKTFFLSYSYWAEKGHLFPKSRTFGDHNNRPFCLLVEWQD